MPAGGEPRRDRGHEADGVQRRVDVERHPAAGEGRREPGLARCLLGDDQRQRPRSPETPSARRCRRRSPWGTVAKTNTSGARVRPHRGEQFPKVRLAAQSAPHRNATAAATGPITENSSRQRRQDQERRQERVGLGDRGIARRHAEDQHRDHQRQHQHRNHQPAARQRDRDRGADGADEGDGRRADQQRQRRRADAGGTDVHEQAEQRRRHDQRQHARRPVRQAFHEHRERRHMPVGRQDHQVERAVLAIGLEQPVEAEQAGQQRADPQDRRADAGQQVEVRPDRERYGGNEARKNSTPVNAPPPARMPRRRSRRKRAITRGDPWRMKRQAGGRKGTQASAAIPNASVLAPAIPSGWWVAATTIPPPARCSFASPANSPSERASSPAVGSSSSQIGRRADQQSGDRRAALLAGGEIAERQMADAGEPDPFQRLLRAELRARRERPPRRRGSRLTVSAVFIALRWPR